MIDFSLMLINNNRSKAYLQNLIKHGYIPKFAIVLNDKKTTLVEHTHNDKMITQETNQKFIRSIDELNIEFDEKEHILKTIIDNKISYCLVDTLDVNSNDVINEVRKIDQKYIIYSGPGGSILRKEILSLGKKFIHTHPGLLPKFRGSTTMYYSILYDSTVGCSVIILKEGIDEGSVLYENSYKIKNKNIDFDYVLDPLLRAKTLIEFFKKNCFLAKEQDSSQEVGTFYIIHPFLKHKAILQHDKREI